MKNTTHQPQPKYVEKTPAVEAFLREAKRYPQLSAEESAALAAEAQKGNRKAANILACSHMSWLYKIVTDSYINHGTSLEDLLQDGMVSVSNAVRSYNPEKGAFTTYSKYCIDNDLRRVSNESQVFGRMPDGCLGQKKMIAKAIAVFQSDYCTSAEPTDDYIADYTGLSESRVSDLRRTDVMSVSIDDEYRDGKVNAAVYKTDGACYYADEMVKETMGDRLQDDDPTVAYPGLREEIDRLLAKESNRDRGIFLLYNDLEEEGMRTSDIASLYGVSDPTVLNVDKRIKRKLRKSALLREMAG